MSKSAYPPPIVAHRHPPPTFHGTPPPPPPPRGPGFGRVLLTYVAWGAGITVAFAGISALFGGRRSQESHPTTKHPSSIPSSSASKTTANPAATRPIFNCTVEEDVLRQCQTAGGDCNIYQKRVHECHRRESEGSL